MNPDAFSGYGPVGTNSRRALSEEQEKELEKLRAERDRALTAAFHAYEEKLAVYTDLLKSARARREADEAAAYKAFRDREDALYARA